MFFIRCAHYLNEMIVIGCNVDSKRMFTTIGPTSRKLYAVYFFIFLYFNMKVL